MANGYLSILGLIGKAWDHGNWIRSNMPNQIKNIVVVHLLTIHFNY